MRKSTDPIPYRSASLLVISSCAAGLGVGLWAAGTGPSPTDQALAGLATLLLVGVIAFLWIFWLNRSWNRAVQSVEQALESLSRGDVLARTHLPPDHGLHLVGLMVHEVGLFLENLQCQNQEQRQREKRQELREAMQRFGQGVARDVQKPLAGIIGYLTAVLKQPGVEGQLKNLLVLGEQEAQGVRETMEKLLRFARNDPLQLEELDMGETLAQLKKDREEALSKQGIKCLLKLGPHLPRVQGDLYQIRFALNALLDNAREAMSKSGGTLEIGANADPDQRLVIMIRDEGCGIPATEHPKVFTPFFSTKEARKGTGLSLSIADKILEQHGGHLDFWSEPGKGSIFFAILPPATPVRAARAPTPPPAAIRTPTPPPAAIRTPTQPTLESPGMGNDPTRLSPPEAPAPKSKRRKPKRVTIRTPTLPEVDPGDPGDDPTRQSGSA